MAEKKPSLTVLGGPLAGTRFVLEGAGSDVVLGSDPACHFRLELQGVSPQHARIRVEPDAAFTIEDAGSEHGLHVNDTRVAGAVALRNGDIVWLGTPGEADVVMLQCILPARPAAPAPPPAPAATPEPSLSEDETLALALESETAPPKTEIIEPEHAPTGFYTVDDAAAASVPFAAQEESAPAEPPRAGESEGASAAPFATADNDLVVAEDDAGAESPPFVVDSAPPPPPPPHFEDDTREQTFEFEGNQATVVMANPEAGPTAPVYSADTGFMEEEASTVVMASEPEPTMALPPPPPAEPPTELIARPAPPPPVATPPPPPPVSAPPAAKAAAKPAAPAAPRPARPAPAAAPAPARRPAAARPQPPPRVEADDTEDEPRRSSSPMALYAGLGVAAVVALGGGYWAFTKFRGGATASEPAPPPTTVAVARATPPPTTVPPVVPETPVEALPEPTPEPALPTPAAVATPTTPTTTLRAAPSPLPSPTAPAKKGAATPPPTTTPAGPSPEQLRAQQVATLLGQADAALASGQFDQAIGHFDEVLRLEPGNGKATADRASAVSMRDAARKKFVAGRTVVATEKAAGGGGLAGFEGAAVQKTPDFSGRIEFEMSPASGLKSGDAWTMKVFLVNDGKKAIKIGGMTATTNVNGTGSGGPVSPSTREVAPQQRVQLGQVTGSWREGTTTWATDVLVTANKGDSLKNTLTWR